MAKCTPPLRCVSRAGKKGTGGRGPAYKINSMIGRPTPDEADSYFSTYIQKVNGDDPLRAIENQLDQYSPWLRRISEEKSLSRYAPGKWSVKQVLSHISDTERTFAFRALWFASGFPFTVRALAFIIPGHVEHHCRILKEKYL